VVLAVLLAAQIGPALGEEHPKKASEAHPAAKDAHPAEAKHEDPNPMKWQWETAIWTVVIFLILFFVLKKNAWGPILEGMKKREKTITDSIEQAKILRAENAKAQTDFQAQLDSAHAEIPKLMEQARKDAAALREQIRTDANAEVQKERQRLLREIGIAQDQALQEIWNQAAQLATLISAKAIGRSLSADDHRRLIDEAMTDLKEKAARR
jgi:F-type H+-transporting ATPase subunit b